MKAPAALALICVALAWLAPAALAERDPALAGYFSAPLRIATADAEHEFVAYLAVTDRQRTHGLMFVRDLPDDHGMLFLYKQPWPITMWMKNTYIPLDILFIRPDGTISNIAESTTPLSLASIRASEPVTGVLELNAGTVARLGIGPGDQIVYRAFGPKPAAP